MQHRTLAAIAAASLLAAFAAQANKGASYEAPKAEPSYDRFTLTGGVNYLLPSMNGLDYVSYYNILTNSTTPYQLDRGYNFGYFLGFGYMISDRYDLQVSWTQLDTNNSDSSETCDACTITTTSNEVIIFFPVEGVNAKTQESLNYQAADATLGQIHHLGDNLMTRIFAGVRYAKVDNTTENVYAPGGPPLVVTESYDSSFSGIGPVIGLDMNYEVYDWFGIVAHVATAFLIGEQKSNSYFDYPGEIGQPSVDSEDITRMVPALDAKLGANLSIPFMDHQDRFVIEAGYQVDYYFDVVDQMQSNPLILDAFITGAEHNYANVGFMGPYLNVSAKF
jgi:hypothetical protein